jgi:hypothetical protein
MDVSTLCTALAQQADAILALTADISDAAARQHVKAGEWSMLEVMCHLYDEEREDFRIRVIQTLTQPHLPLPGIDPEGWVVSRRYAEQSFQQMRQQWASERQQSLQLLAALTAVDWQTPLNHPRLQQLCAAQVAWAWLAHDLLHLRQLNELRYLHFARQTDSYGYGYAGDWHSEAI